MKLSKVLSKKIIRLSILMMSTLGLLVSSGVSFAKYYSENNFDDNASAAKFSANIIYSDNSIQLPELRASVDLGYHAFIYSFRIDFNNCDVKCKYSLSLKLGNVSDIDYDNVTDLDDTSFILTGTVPKVSSYNSISGAKEEAPLSEWNTNITSYSLNTIYYATSIDGINYTWDNISNILSTNQMDLVKDVSMDLINRVHYFKVMFFIEFTYEDISHEDIEKSKLFYSLDMVQEV